MTNHHITTVDARDLTSRLTQLEQVSTPTNVDTANNEPTMSTRPRQNRTSSFSASPIQLSHLPRFTKSATMSTSSSSGSDMSRFNITHAEPHTKTHRASAEIGVGEFSKPRVPKRSRRGTQSSTRSEGSAAGDDFRYYGRHSNQWLFNDFSVTESIKKGWGRVFGKEDKGDWYERRD